MCGCRMTGIYITLNSGAIVSVKELPYWAIASVRCGMYLMILDASLPACMQYSYGACRSQEVNEL